MKAPGRRVRRLLLFAVYTSSGLVEDEDQIMKIKPARALFYCVISVLYMYLPLTQAFPSHAEEISPIDSTMDIEKEAKEYLWAFSHPINFLVWPNRILPYEFTGEKPEALDGVIGEIQSVILGRVFLYHSNSFPLISINFYQSSGSSPIEEFISKSNIYENFRNHILRLDLGSDPCAFTVANSRNTWAAAAAIFVDTDRLDGPELRECLEVALQYVMGLPMHDDARYGDAPEQAVRVAILKSILDCSSSAAWNEGYLERSRDGIFALPSMECVLDKINAPHEN